MPVLVAAALVGAVALHGLRSPSKSHNAEQVVLTGGESIASDALDPAHHTPRKISTRGVMDSGVHSARGESQPERAELAASDGRRPLLEHPAVHYSVAGRVVTSEGKPAANVEVWIHLEVDVPTKEAREQFLLDHGLETLSPRLRTDPSGSFRFAGLPCVPYSLYVGDSVDGNLPRSELLDANAVVNIKLLHRLGISGHVYGLGGKRGEIRVAPCDTAFESVMGSDVFHRFGGAEHKALTGSDGAYTIEGLQPGWYEVLAHAEGLGTASRRVELTTELEQVDLELTRSLTFAGRVEADFPVDERRSGLPLSPRPVPDDLFPDDAATDGSFRFENLPAGTYELTVWYRAAHKRRTDVRRTFSVNLENDITDFHRMVSIGTERVSVRVDGPIGEH